MAEAQQAETAPELTGAQIWEMGAKRLAKEEAKSGKPSKAEPEPAAAETQDETVPEEPEAAEGGEDGEDGEEKPKPKKPKPIGQEWSALNDKKRKHAARVEADTQRIAAEREEVRTLAQQAVSQFGKYAEAQKHWDGGDAEAACRKAFGCSAAEFNKRLLKETHNRDPKLVELERKLEAKEQAEREALEAQRAQETERSNRQLRVDYATRVGEALTRSPEPEVKRLAKDPDFAELIVAEQEASGWDGQKFRLSVGDAQVKVMSRLKRMLSAMRSEGAESDPDGEKSLESEKGRQESREKPTTQSGVRRNPRNRTASSGKAGEWNEAEWRQRTIARLNAAAKADD